MEQARRGNLKRSREKGAWIYQINHKRVSKKPVLSLMRQGLLEPAGLGPPYEMWQRIAITIKGLAALVAKDTGG